MDKILIDIDRISAEDLYEYICARMSFNKVIQLYKLLQHKMTYLDDEPRCTIAAYESTPYEPYNPWNKDDKND